MKRPLRIVLVDDDRVYQFTTERLLKRIDPAIEFRWFRDGEEALEHLTRIASDDDRLPDVLLLDINMPFMDGWQFLEAFRANKGKFRKHIDLYMISSSADERDQARALQTGDVVEYLEKPLTAEDLERVLARYGVTGSDLH